MLCEGIYLTDFSWQKILPTECRWLSSPIFFTLVLAPCKSATPLQLPDLSPLITLLASFPAPKLHNLCWTYRHKIIVRKWLKLNVHDPIKMQINLHQPESCCLVRIEGWHLIWCPQFLCCCCADVFHPKFNFIAHQAMLDRLVWYVRPPRDVEAIADCSRQSFNRSVLPTKAATYESRFTIHRPTRMDSMTNMAAIQMIHTIQGPECRGGNEEQQIVRSRNACSHYAAGISARN